MKYGYCYESENLNIQFLMEAFGSEKALNDSIEDAKYEWNQDYQLWSGTREFELTLKEKGLPYVFSYNQNTKEFTKLEILELPTMND